MSCTKVVITTFPTYTPPMAQPPQDGGRIMTPAGEIAQIVRDQPFRYLASLEFAHRQDVARGNHYHLCKHEFLYVITGKLQAVFKDIDSGETETHIITAGMLVEIAPRCAHVFMPLDYTLAVEFSATPYDPEDAHPYVLDARVE
jgi:dTDP-4-dehydrorhamnose 3,5-epimerase-like enzyme